MKKDQILAEVICPLTSRTYDFVISRSLIISDLAEKICSEISEREGNSISLWSPEDTDIFSSEYALPLDREKTLADYGIISGCSLMII